MTGLWEIGDKVRPIAEQLGVAVIAWGWLEHVTQNLVALLMALDRNEANAALGHLDIKDHVNILKTLGFLKKPNDPWFAELEQFLNHVDNDLRAVRNRMIHDVWGNDSVNVLRIDPAMKLRRPQSFQRELQRDAKAISASEIAVFTSDVFDARRQAVDLHKRYVEHYSAALPGTPVPQSPPLATPAPPSPAEPSAKVRKRRLRSSDRRPAESENKT